VWGKHVLSVPDRPHCFSFPASPFSAVFHVCKNPIPFCFEVGRCEGHRGVFSVCASWYMALAGSLSLKPLDLGVWISHRGLHLVRPIGAFLYQSYIPLGTSYPGLRRVTACFLDRFSTAKIICASGVSSVSFSIQSCGGSPHGLHVS
jgi:hypothetical protein